MSKTSKERRKRRRNQRFNNTYNGAGPKLNYFTLPNFVVFIGVAFLSLAGVALFYLTAGLYIEIVAQLAGESKVWTLDLTEASPFGWILGSLFNGLGLSAWGLVGLFLFCILQIGELLPTFIEESPEIMAWMIKRFRAQKRIEPRSNDSAASRKMIDQYNSYYDNFLQRAKDFMVGCFIVDIVFCALFAKTVYVASQGSFYRLLESYGGLSFEFGMMPNLNTFKVACSWFLLLILLKLCLYISRLYRVFAEREPIATGETANV